MVMELAEQPSRRNRLIKSGRVSIKRGEEFRQEGVGQPRQERKSFPTEEACIRGTENSRTASWNIELKAEIIPD
jgi:hypothetical protein